MINVKCNLCSHWLIVQVGKLCIILSIGSLKNVTTLKIDENQLMFLPDSIGG